MALSKLIRAALGRPRDAFGGRSWRRRSRDADAAALVLGLLALGRLAITDPLTGLRNRRGLELAAQQAVADCRRAGAPLSVAHLDLDDFKAINDNFGHAVGDRVLADCAKYWSAMLEPDQILARVGGDEFILVLPGCDRGEAEALLSSLRFASPTAWSHGLAQLRLDDDLERCLLRADAALYAAKDRRSRSRRFSEQTRHHHLLRREGRFPAASWADLN